MNRLILYDTCNFRDYPVGGQVTSIKNFLRFLTEAYPERCEDVLLAGVSCDPDEVGRLRQIETAGGTFSFLAVVQAERDLGNVKKSLRLEYMKGLWKYRRLIAPGKDDVNYIHTPEAFAAVRLMRPGAVCYVFSHGTYLNMYRRVRFFKKAPLIRYLFQSFLMQVIRKSTAVFALDRETVQDYAAYNPRVIHVGNSIVCHPWRERPLPGEPVRLLYAGRLSAVKNVGPIIEAAKGWERDCRLDILGDGEERRPLEEKAQGSSRIRFHGARTPDEVQTAMAEADMLVMNSTFEGIPMIILEALSNGLPVVTTDVGGIGEVLDYGLDSEVTDGSVQGIRDAMERVLSDYARHSRQAYEKSLRFDYRRVNRKVFSVLNESLHWTEAACGKEPG